MRAAAPRGAEVADDEMPADPAGGDSMLFSSLAHGLVGWPMMRGLLRDGEAGEDLIGALAAGWYHGSASMAAFGGVVIVAGLRLRWGDRSGVVPVAVISSCYVLFGSAGLPLPGGARPGSRQSPSRPA